MAEQQQQQQAAQQPGALNLPTLLQTLSQQLISLSTVVQAIACVASFQGSTEPQQNLRLGLKP